MGKYDEKPSFEIRKKFICACFCDWLRISDSVLRRALCKCQICLFAINDVNILQQSKRTCHVVHSKNQRTQKGYKVVLSKEPKKGSPDLILRQFWCPYFIGPFGEVLKSFLKEPSKINEI